MAAIDHSPGRQSFGADAEGYEAARPPYPADLFGWMKDLCGLGAHSRCFEIGAGAGLATRPMLALPVGSLLAIEPDARLAERLCETAGADALSGRLQVTTARFEEVALAPGVFDFGFAATAMHWLPRGKSLARVHGALRPGAWFAMWWQVFVDPDQPDAFDQAIDPLFRGLEEGPRKSGPRKAFALDVPARLGELKAAGFGCLQHSLHRETMSFDAAAIVALYGTFSRVAGAPEATRRRLLEEAARLVREEFGGAVRRRVQTSAFVGRRPEKEKWS